jgi:hypothetical protein
VSDEDTPDNVIEFKPPPAPAEPAPLVLDPEKYAQIIPLTQRRSFGVDCHHQAEREVDHGARRIICKACGRDLDPFDVLQDIAVRWEQRHFWWKQLCADIKEAEARLVALKRDEANTRARIKRLGLSPRRSRKGVDLSR